MQRRVYHRSLPDTPCYTEYPGVIGTEVAGIRNIVKSILVTFDEPVSVGVSKKNKNAKWFCAASSLFHSKAEAREGKSLPRSIRFLKEDD